MEMSYKELRDNFIGLKHKLESDKRKLRKTKIKLLFLKSKRREWIMARDFFVNVAKLTQKDITNYLEGTVSLALDVIPSEEPMRLLSEFETKRNQSEMNLYLQEGKNEPIPLLNTVDTVGNSVEEIISYASRLCVWSIQNPRSAPFQVHDEPLRTLKGENRIMAAKVMKEIQEELGLQMVIVTNEPKLTSYSDKVIECVKVGGATVIK